MVPAGSGEGEDEAEDHDGAEDGHDNVEHREPVRGAGENL